MPGFVMPRGPSVFKVRAKYWEWQEKRLHFTSYVIPCADKEALSLKHFSTVNATRCKLFGGYTCLFMKCVLRSYFSSQTQTKSSICLFWHMVETRDGELIVESKRDKNKTVKVKLNWSWLSLVFISLRLLFWIRNTSRWNSNRKHVTQMWLKT